jgi:uncharacterized protein (DUF305 family)
MVKEGFKGWVSPTPGVIIIESVYRNMNMNHMNNNHYIVMFFIMIVAGALSTMNVWADSWDDMRFSLNDVYMILLMTGWMLLFMGLYYKHFGAGLCGLVLVIGNLWAIRTQFAVTTTQFVRGMIPHHSMAVHMSKRLREKGTPLREFADGIIATQEKEIAFMKQLMA